MTSRPCAAIATAKLADTVVLPTPPLPPVTAITLTGREALSSASAAACRAVNRVSRMGGSSTKVADVVGFVVHRLALLQRHGSAHQPDALAAGRVQIFRH